MTDARLGQRDRDGGTERTAAGDRHSGRQAASEQLGRGARKSGGCHRQRTGLGGEPRPSWSGEIPGQEGVRRHHQTGGTQGVEQGTSVVRADVRSGQHLPLAAGAVEQVEQPDRPGVGHLDQDRPLSAEAELKGVPVAPETGEPR